MKLANKDIFFYARWAARILVLAFAVFLSIFSLDAFSNNFTFWENVFSLFIHLLPVFVILATLFIFWNRPLAGALIYFLLGLVYIIWAWGRFPLSVYFMMAGPLFLISALFFLSRQRTSLG